MVIFKYLHYGYFASVATCGDVATTCPPQGSPIIDCGMAPHNGARLTSGLMLLILVTCIDYTIVTVVNTQPKMKWLANHSEYIY